MVIGASGHAFGRPNCGKLAGEWHYVQSTIPWQNCGGPLGTVKDILCGLDLCRS